MDVKTMLEIKQSVLLLLSAKGSKESQSHRSVVLGKSEDGIVLLLPRGVDQLAVPHMSFDLQFLWEKSLYQGRCQVLLTADKPVPCIIATWPDEIEKVQRRSYVRLDLNVKLDLYEPSSKGLICQANTLDISAGGLAAEVPVKLPVGRVLNARIHFDSPLDVVGKVIRCENRGEKMGSWLVSLKFEDIKEADQNTIMRHIFNEQLIRKRKGLL